VIHRFIFDIIQYTQGNKKYKIIKFLKYCIYAFSLISLGYSRPLHRGVEIAETIIFTEQKYTWNKK